MPRSHFRFGGGKTDVADLHSIPSGDRSSHKAGRSRENGLFSPHDL
jgi:hypothetical protein